MRKAEVRHVSANGDAACLTVSLQTSKSNMCNEFSVPDNFSAHGSDSVNLVFAKGQMLKAKSQVLRFLFKCLGSRQDANVEYGMIK